MVLAQATRGRVISTSGSTVVFKPANTNYELHLQAVGGAYAGPIDQAVDGVIRGVARKIYTVPSGGLFITPIIGPTRILQGRVISVSAHELTLSCPALVTVTLPTLDNSIELALGPIAEGSLVNVVLKAGATIEIAS